jgi:hypothetical protein
MATPQQVNTYRHLLDGQDAHWSTPAQATAPTITDEYADAVAEYQAAQRGLQRQLDSAVRAARQTRQVP